MSVFRRSVSCSLAAPWEGSKDVSPSSDEGIDQLAQGYAMQDYLVQEHTL